MDAEKLDALLKPVKENFRKTLEQSLPAFVKFKQDISGGELVSPDVYDAIKARCHKIKGSSKTLGFNALGTFAAEVEKCIGVVIAAENEYVPTNELIAKFDAFLSSVKAAI